MSFSKWLHSLPPEFWLTFVLAIVSFFMVIYQFYDGKQRKAATFFLILTTCLFGALAWTFFGRHRVGTATDDTKQPPAHRTWEPVKDDLGANAWANMAREPDEAPAKEDGEFKALTLSVEGIAFSQDHTLLRVAVKNGSADLFRSLQPALGAYIIDDRGTSYDLQAEARPEEREAFFSTGEVRPGVTERFELTFPPVPSPTSLTLHHPQFVPITIYRYQSAPAVVSFCRPFNLIGVTSDMDFSCDGQHIVDLSTGKSAKVELTSGKHVCQAQYKDVFKADTVPMDLDVAAGKSYYIQAQPEVGLWRGKIILKSVQTEALCTNP